MGGNSLQKTRGSGEEKLSKQKKDFKKVRRKLSPGRSQKGTIDGRKGVEKRRGE